MPSANASRQKRSPVALIAIGIFKLVKSVLLLALGLGLVNWRDQDLGQVASNWINTLWIGRPYFDRMISKLSSLDDRTLEEVAAGSFIYSALLLIEGCIRRLIDLTIPNNGARRSTNRFENRYNRPIPVLLCPWKDGEPIVSEAIFVITKDIADRGIGLILNQPCAATDVVIGFAPQGIEDNELPCFFLCKRRTNVAIGGGFWLFGVEVEEFVNLSYHEELQPLISIAKKLVPPSC